MKEVKLETTLAVYDNLDELPQDIINLMNQAAEARKKAEALYLQLATGFSQVKKEEEKKSQN